MSTNTVAKPFSTDDLPKIKKMRPRTLFEMQPSIIQYSVGITFFSPLACCYSLCKLNPQVTVPFSKMASLAARVAPVQVGIRIAQMNITTPVKENLNPWAAFALIGVLQGGVYGQCNVFFAKQLGISKSSSILGMFRGARFAAARDTISQGIPFMCSSLVRKYVFDPILPTDDSSSAHVVAIKHWASILSTSITSTYASQGFHNMQTTMQANQSLSATEAVQELWKRNGLSLFYKGAEARVGLLLAINVFNQLVLKPAWEGIEVKE